MSTSKASSNSISALPSLDDPSLAGMVDEPVAFLYSQLNALLTENIKQLNEANRKLKMSVPLEQYQNLQLQLDVCVQDILPFVDFFLHHDSYFPLRTASVKQTRKY